jgi:hypothetical protein
LFELFTIFVIYVGQVLPRPFTGPKHFWAGPNFQILYWQIIHFHGELMCSPVLFSLITVNSTNWQENIRPKLFAKLNSRDYQSFSRTLKVLTKFCNFCFLF